MSQTLPEIIKQCYRDKTGRRSRHLSCFLFIMLTLLAESKTMASQQGAVSENEFKAHSPLLENIADSLMLHIEKMPVNELAETLGISNSLAVKTYGLAFDFPHKVTGYQALFAFTGEAYRGLDIGSVNPEILERTRQTLKIISSVYGILSPYDIIKPYRCEFNKGIFPDNKTPIQIFKPKVTVALVNYIKEQKITDIIDLLPADADKMIDWKIVRAFSPVHKICFQTIDNQGRLKTPIAKRLKELRGIMYRTILTENIESFQQLTKVDSPHFIFSPADSKPGLPVFISS